MLPPTWSDALQGFNCEAGGMVDTRVLEARAERHASSILALRTDTESMMANYGYITSRKWFRVDELEGHVKEIIARFFPLLTARMYISSDSVGVTVRAPDDEFNGLFIEIETKNRLSTRHPAGLMWAWVFTVMQNELAVKYDGRRTDEGVVGQIANKPTGTWPTYEAWLRATHSSSEEWVQNMLASVKDIAWLHN